MNKNKHAFTLVELIVVITIIAILGTIAFISLQGYSASSRDSTRISDLSAMKTSLELFHLDAGKYPATTAGFMVTYSGAEVWTQGIFGETTFTNVEKLDKIPKDPLTDKEYTYSVTKTKQEYQLAGIMESGEITLNNNVLLNQTNAGDTIATAIVTGNYNGQVLKTETGGICEILSLPSIISSEGDTTIDLKTILDNKSLVYSGYNNLPSNYTGGKYKTNGGFEFESKKLIVYSDTQECKPLYAENPTARIELIKNLQTAYSGTIIKNTDNIKGLIALNISDLAAVTLLSTTLVNNNLGGNISQTNNIVIPTPVNGVCGTANNIAMLTAPSTNLCSEGTQTLVTTATNQYTWICDGINLGTFVNCSAARQYSVTFNGNTNTSGSMSNQLISATNAANLTTNTFVKTGYAFDGWATTSGGLVVYANGASYTIGTSNVILYAKWIVTVDYVANIPLNAPRATLKNGCDPTRAVLVTNAPKACNGNYCVNYTKDNQLSLKCGTAGYTYYCGNTSSTSLDINHIPNINSHSNIEGLTGNKSHTTNFTTRTTGFSTDIYGTLHKNRCSNY